MDKPPLAADARRREAGGRRERVAKPVRTGYIGAMVNPRTPRRTLRFSLATMSQASALLAVVCLAVGATGASAQAPPPVSQPSSPRVAAVTAQAVYAGENKPVRGGLIWRVLQEDPDGSMPAIVARSTDAVARFELPAGAYILHATYGYASGWRRITVGANAVNERVTLSAGALKLAGSIADRPIATNLLTFSVFVPLAGNSEGRLVAENLRAGDLLRLPEGTYHVVSTYGDANAIRRADIKVESGRLVEATIMHRAAKATLKLVAQPGGEAFAGTNFTVLTPGGDVIREAIGAFPEVILAEGEYMLIARQEDKVHTHEFRIEAGLDRDIEVVVGR
jgi:hypothetical protein